MGCVEHTLLRVDRLLSSSVLSAPVPKWLPKYEPDQAQHFSTPESHEQRFSWDLMHESPSSFQGRKEFQLLLNSLINAFDKSGSTYVHGGVFDVDVSVDAEATYVHGEVFDVHANRVFLTDLTFGWEANQQNEYIALFAAAAGGECVRREIEYLCVSGPSLPIMSRVCDRADRFFHDENVGMFLYIEAKTLLDIVSPGISQVFSHRGPYVMLKSDGKCFESTALNVCDINNAYVDDFAHMLYRLHCRIAMGYNFDLLSQTSHVFIDYKFQDELKVGVLQMLEIRPCAQRLGLGRLLLWRMIRSFFMFGCEKFVVSSAVGATQQLCDSLGFQKEDGGDDDIDCFMMSDVMKTKVEPSACGINSVLSASGELFMLDTTKFPSASDLNNQEFVDARGKSR